MLKQVARNLSHCSNVTSGQKISTPVGPVLHMNYFLLFLVQSGQTDGQTESDAYEPTVKFAQVGPKMQTLFWYDIKLVHGQTSSHQF